MAREDLLSRTFVELADILAEGYDPIEFLRRLTERCVSVLGVAEAGVVLADSQGQLRALAPSSERIRLIGLIGVQRQDGPCLDCWRSGEAVREDHLAGAVAAGRTSPRPPSAAASPRPTPCRCACATSATARSACSPASPAA